MYVLLVSLECTFTNFETVSDATSGRYDEKPFPGLK